MKFIIIKYLTTAGLVVLISEFAKRNDKLGSLVASLPIVTLLVLFWLYFENQPITKIANHAYYTFWYVVPTLPMFLAFPALIHRFGFWAAIVASIIMTAICFVLLTITMHRFGVELLP